MEKIKLVMVTTLNNNKYYNMEQLSRSEFRVTYGRVDKTAVSRVYPMSKWDSIYRAKTKKGYRDVTELAAVVEQVFDDTRGIGDVGDPKVARLLQKLQALARGSIRRNYTISAEAVTQSMIDEAQSIVNRLSQLVSTAGDGIGYGYDINELLLNLYHVIPRRMGNVKDHLVLPAGSLPEYESKRLVMTEQANLDVMAQQVGAVAVPSPSDAGKGKSILDSMGLVIVAATPTEILDVKSKTQGDSSKIGDVYKVINARTQAAFDKHLNWLMKQKVSNTRLSTNLFWHGSRNENWLSILDAGLRIRPSGVTHTGSMFGDGIYFSDLFKKSLGYTSVRGSYWAGGNDSSGFMALFKVHTGRQLEISRHNSSCYNLSASNLERKGGYDSVWGKRGYDLINSEYVVFNVAQCTVAYLVQIS